MRNRIRIAACALSCWACVAHADYTLQRVIHGQTAGLGNLVYATSPAGDPRLFMVEQNGAIKTYDPSTQLVSSFFNVASNDISDDFLSTGGEKGLLGLAFDPHFSTNGHFYTHSTRMIGGQLTTEIARYTVNSTPAPIGDSRHLVMRYSQPFENHNGGWIGFGPDGYLYIASGDGGDSNDPQGNAQNPSSPLGKILRVDTNNDEFPSDDLRNYAIPDTNPLAGGASATDDALWALGLRNPYRASFDRQTGDFYIGDVGQNTREEIDRIPAGQGGLNFGWRAREGTVDNPAVNDAAPADAVDPIYDYAQVSPRAVTGGYVYRGPIAELQGKYVFGDFYTARLWAINPDGSGFSDLSLFLQPNEGTLNLLASFAEDAQGNLYVLDYDGDVFAVVPIPGAAFLFGSGTLGLAGLLRGRSGRRDV